MDSIRKAVSEFNRLYIEFDFLYHEAAAEIGLSDCAFRLLYEMYEEDGELKQRALSKLLAMPPQTINSATKRLETDGFLRLEKIDGEKGKRICLTDSGKKFVSDHFLPIKLSEERVCAEFSEEEMQTLLSLFGRLVTSLEREFSNNIK